MGCYGTLLLFFDELIPLLFLFELAYTGLTMQMNI
jgi:hypothetical protein